MKYRKKPVVIDAFRWTADRDQSEDPEWIVEAIKNGNAFFETPVGESVGVSVLVVGLAALAVGTYAPDVASGAAFVVIVASFLMGGAVGMNSPGS